LPDDRRDTPWNTLRRLVDTGSTGELIIASCSMAGWRSWASQGAPGAPPAPDSDPGKDDQKIAYRSRRFSYIARILVVDSLSRRAWWSAPTVSYISSLEK
jgi:hypothetical protein